MSKLKLTPDEKQLLLALPTEGSSLIAKLTFIVDERQKKTSKPKWRENTNKFFLGFCNVATKASGLVETLLPQSPEYTVTFGVLLLLFKVSSARVWRAWS